MLGFIKAKQGIKTFVQQAHSVFQSHTERILKKRFLQKNVKSLLFYKVGVITFLIVPLIISTATAQINTPKLPQASTFQPVTINSQADNNTPKSTSIPPIITQEQKRLAENKKQVEFLKEETTVINLFNQLKIINGDYEYLFPNRNNPKTYISENTFLYALYRMGYHSRTTAHGFRSTASTILNEKGFRSDAIERQLAHGERNRVRASYNFAQYLPERRDMMQWWADYILGLSNEW